MKVTTEPKKCIASGACVFASPRVFTQDDDGIVVLLQESPDVSLADEVDDAAAACPAMAIEAHHDD